MKIDIHVHTKKVKQGDSPAREITPTRFAETILSTDVKIVAITNHNVFDLQQYDDILGQIDDAIQVWPGIELDVVDEGKRAHLIVIVDPGKKLLFADAVQAMTKGSSPDQFVISLEDAVGSLDKLNPVYVAHYLQKKPDLTEEALNKLARLVSNEKRIIKEAANSISAGIFIAHGHASIFGSDVQDWGDYPSVATQLPELRLPVDSFDRFCLLLEKDVSTINTIISRKESEVLRLRPFDDSSEVVLTAYNDVNVVFGPKGTGKTKILEAIARYYSSTGVHASVFKSSPDTLSEKYDMKGKNLSKNLNPFGIAYCTDEVSRLKSAREIDITAIHKYRDYFLSESRNKNAKKMKIKDLPAVSEIKARNAFQDYRKAHTKILDMIQFLSSNGSVAEVAGTGRIESIVDSLSALASDIKKRTWVHFADWKAASLTNAASKRFRDEVAKKTGTLTKPTHTGFRQFAGNRLSIKRDAQEVIKNISVAIEDENATVGTLGPDKGEMECVTTFRFQDGTIRDSHYLPVKAAKKTQTNFAKAVKKVESTALSDELFDSISELNAVEDVGTIESVYELLLFWRRFTLDGEPYEPSTGECSMLNLHAELAEEKEVYILDEPEKSLGNEYINDVIIPLINDKARQGKKVFISTHDANLAVRTLPYNSIYRCHDKDGYSTYIGNPFSNALVCQARSKPPLDWKRVSMKTLEGGERAFGERGRIYGNS